MKSIGFKNFRKFIEFPELKFNDITLMVGKNNSGKSTLVKAILLIIGYLKDQQNTQFSFSTSNVKDVNIVSFDRARCKFQSDDTIFFNCEIAPYYNATIKISGDNKSISGNIEEVTINDLKQYLVFNFSHKTNTIRITKKRETTSEIIYSQNSTDVKTRELNSRIKELSQKQIENSDLLREIDDLNKELEQIKITQLNKTKVVPTNTFSLEYEINLDRSPSNGNFEDYVKEFLNENENEKRQLINNREKDEFTDEQNELLEEVNLVLESKSELIDSICNFVKSINNHYYYYWSAENQKQSALFSIRDENNALARAIHDFYKMKIQKGDEEWLFIENQMHCFDIGNKFELFIHAGEAYECKIIEKQEFAVSLADKGMGSIQLMTLLFRLATIIKQQRLHKRNITLIIEEPELNLHPRLQSQLMSLFKDMNENYDIKFIIETHSEYVVRQSQVIVNKAHYKDETDLDNNKFFTYYFKSDGTPYLMKYRIDGKFSNEFGTGFFDVAADLAFEIF